MKRLTKNEDGRRSRQKPKPETCSAHSEETPLLVGVLRHRQQDRLLQRQIPDEFGSRKIPLLFVVPGLPETVSVRYVGRHSVLVVQITDDMMNEAGQRAENFQRHHSVVGFKETLSPGRTLDREISGMLGHFAAAICLFADWREALQHLKLGVGLDDPDFAFVGKRFDVKTAGASWHKLLLVPVANFEKRHADFYIGAQMMGPRQVWIWGYSTRDEVAEARVRDLGRGDDYCIPLRELHPLTQLRGLDSSLLRFMTFTWSMANPGQKRRRRGREVTVPGRGKRATRRE